MRRIMVRTGQDTDCHRHPNAAPVVARTNPCAAYGAPNEGHLVDVEGHLVDVEQWNRLYPVGTTVAAYPGARHEDPAYRCGGVRLDTRTRARAWQAHGRAVVMVEGHSAWIALSHVDPETMLSTDDPAITVSVA
ncbi:hypothetical protein ABH941_004822 [Streptacidiphilus sp. EB103A]